MGGRADPILTVMALDTIIAFVALLWTMVQQALIIRLDRRVRYAAVSLEATPDPTGGSVAIVNRGTVGVILLDAEDSDGHRIDCFEDGWNPILLPGDGDVFRLTDSAPDHAHLRWRSNRRLPFLKPLYGYSFVRLR